MAAWIGLDFGGTNLRAALVEPGSGTLYDTYPAGDPAFEGPHGVMDAMARLVQTSDLSSQPGADDIAGIGIGCPASVDLARGC